MALRDVKGQQQAVEGVGAESFLRCIQDPDDNAAGLSGKLKLYLAPLTALAAGSETSGKENRPKCDDHSLAKQHLPFLVQLLKQCSGCLTVSQAKIDGILPKKADELFSAMALALDSLQHLRAWISGCSFEIEIQRYRLVRLLLAWKRYSDALAQCWELYRSLCLTVLEGNGGVAESKAAPSATGIRQRRITSKVSKTVEGVNLRPPQPADDSSALPILVTGVAVDLVVCTAENGSYTSAALQTLISISDRLDPWFRMMSPTSAQKQQDTLFKALYKMASMLAEEPLGHEGETVQKFCELALRWCATSSQHGQYAKIARRLSSTLSGHSPKIAFSVCRVALSEVSQRDQLSTLWTSPEVLDLVDCFARICQAAHCNKDGADEIEILVQKFSNKGSVLVAVAGLYAVGLHFAEDENIGEENQKISQLCKYLLDAVAALHIFLGQEAIYFPTMKAAGVVLTAETGRTGGVSVDHSTKTLLGAFKALEYVRRFSVKFVQAKWNAYISTGGCKSATAQKLPQPSKLSEALEQVLHLLCLVAISGLRHKDLTDGEKEVLQKGHKAVLAASIAALRLSVVRTEDTQTHMVVLRKLLQRNDMDSEDLRWLMSSAYNMGVQIFNATNYKLASDPLRLAYEAACARMDLRNAAFSGLETGEYASLVSESLAKCVTLADALSRNDDQKATLDVLVDGLCRWAKAHIMMHPLQSPHALIRLWVKIVCAESKAREGMSCPQLLYDALCSIQPPVPARTLGLLMEEELSVYDGFGAELSKAMKAKILDLLLHNVYVTEAENYERSRVLLEKARVARLYGTELLSWCVSALSEAVSLLEHALDDTKRRGARRLHLLHNLGVVCCVRSFCTYEMDPSSQNIVEDIIRAVKCWRETLNLDREPSSKDLCGEVSETTDLPYGAHGGREAISLLLNVADLIALKGLSVLQDEVQGLICELAAGVDENNSAEGLLTSLWAGRRLSHVLCVVPHSSKFSDSLSTKFGIAADSVECWQEYARKAPVSLLDVRQRLIAEDIHDGHPARDNTEWATGADVVKEIANAQALKLNGRYIHVTAENCFHHFASQQKPKVAQAVLELAAIHHSLAQHALDKGNLEEAMENAREAFQLRFKCFNRTFQTSDKCLARGANDPDSTSAAGVSGTNSVTKLEAVGCAATRAWPSISMVDGTNRGPSQWCILGDFIESLFQVGLIHEKSGGVDDAEKNFREGLRVANFLHLPLVQATFASALGEVNRKRHLWKLATDFFSEAEQVYHQLENNLACKSCVQAGRALLHIRIGDLARRCSDGHLLSTYGYKLFGQSPSQLDSFSDKLDAALLRYSTAKEELSPVLGKGTCSVCYLARSSVEMSLTSKMQPNPQIEDSSHQKSITVMKGEVKPRRSSRNVLSQARKKPDLHDLCDKLDQISLKTGPEATETKQTTYAVKRSARLQQKYLASAGRACEISTNVDTEAGSRNESLSISKEKTRNTQRRTKARGAVEADFYARVGHECEAETAVLASANSLVKVEAEALCPEARDASSCTAAISRRRHTRQKTVSVPVGYPDIMEEEGNVSANMRSSPDDKGRLLHIASMNEWTAFKWEQCGRGLMALALTQEGKSYSRLGHNDLAEQSFLKGLSLLHSVGSRRVIHSGEWNDCKPEIALEVSQTSQFPLEEARLLYHISRVRLQREQLANKIFRLEGERLQQPLMWLYRSFMLCHQMPPLVQKVSKLLALLHVPSSSGGVCLHPGKSIAELHSSAAYFQQASLGTTTRQQHLANVNSKIAALLAETEKGPCFGKRRECLEDMKQALRIVQPGVNSVEACTDSLLTDVPQSMVCCIGIVDAEHAFLLQPEDGSTTTWVLITRMGTQTRPSVMILPLVPLLEGVSFRLEDEDRMQHNGTANAMEKDSLLETVIPEFALIMKESRQSTAGTGPVTTTEQKNAWWKWRTDLDFRLSSLLRTLEDLWLGPWKCFLLGRPLDLGLAEAFERSSKALSKKLESLVKQEAEKNFVQVDEELVRPLLEGLGSLKSEQLEAGIAWILGWNRFNLPDCGTRKTVEEPGSGSAHPGRLQLLAAAAQEFRAAYKASMQLIQYEGWDCEEKIGYRTRGKTRVKRLAKRSSGQDKDTQEDLSRNSTSEELLGFQPPERQPVELVLDRDLQKLPWESLPCVRECEMYRMPSVGSLRALLIHQSYLRTGIFGDSDIMQSSQMIWKGDRPALPTVNAANAYYVLNPSGDLASTQAAFEDWFAHQAGWKGKAGEVPTEAECMDALLERELFIYFGHGSGEQYFSERRVRRLEHCAAAFLMGCGSGRLAPRGDYEPVGVPLSYLMAGCPTAIANLWDVTDGDIDRFSRVLLHVWLGSNKTGSCTEVRQDDSADDAGATLARRKKVRLGRSSKSGQDDTTCALEKSMPAARSEIPVRMGLISEGRSSCRLPFLIGAAPVCYGVPTAIQINLETLQ